MTRRDLVWAALAGAAALALYVRTLAPGLVATVDTPMFQFIGRVLGVPHNPGYPWYVLVTYVFSFVPIGTLPYRINLFSALLGALTVALTYLVARRLECRRPVSLGAALGLASGPVFWSQAVIAEVYTMHSAIVAGLLLALFAWSDSRRPWHFFAAVAVLALGLGHHTTILAFAPGAFLFAVLLDRRFALRLRTLLISGLILGAGLLPYTYILIRSTAPGVYAESRASTLRELVDVMLARQFQARLFAFDWISIVIDRIPSIARGVVLHELTMPGIVLAIAGLLWLLWRRAAAGLLLLTGGGAIAAFAVVYRVVDTPVFLIPALLVLWIAAAAGAERLVRMLARWRVPAAVAALAMLALPAWQVAGHFRDNDRSRDTRAAVYFDALFDVLPARTAIVREDFLADRMVMFKLLGEGAAGDRHVELVRRDAAALRTRLADGVALFAFPKSARQLRRQGLGFSFRPLRLLHGPLSDRLADLEDDAVVAVAVPARYSGAFMESGGATFAAIGGPDTMAAAERSGFVVLGARGAKSGARVQAARGHAQIAAAAGRRIGDTGVYAPAAIAISADEGTATIRQESRIILETSAGVAVAIWDRQGRLSRTWVLEAAHQFRTPLPSEELALHPLEGLWPEQHVGFEPAGVTAAFQSGSVIVRLPRRMSLVVYLADDRPLAPQIVDRSSNDVAVGIASFESGDAVLEQALESDAMREVSFDRRLHTYRVEVTASSDRGGAALIAAGGIPREAVARANAEGTAASLFAADLAGLLRTPEDASEVLLMARDEQAQLTGAGWSPVDWDAIGTYRWMTGPEARLVLPVTAPATRLRVHALFESSEGGTLALRLNGTELSTQALVPGWQVYEWALPVNALRIGVNQAALAVQSAASPPALAVTEVRLLR